MTGDIGDPLPGGSETLLTIERKQCLLQPMTNSDSIFKTADEVEVGDVLVFRPDPSALTLDYLPTVYRKVEKIETETMRRDPGLMVCFLFRPQANSGYWRIADCDDKFEVTTAVDRSCSVLPDGRVIG